MAFTPRASLRLFKHVPGGFSLFPEKRNEPKKSRPDVLAFGIYVRFRLNQALVELACAQTVLALYLV